VKIAGAVLIALSVVFLICSMDAVLEKISGCIQMSTNARMRSEIRNEVERVEPFDESERACKVRVLDWIDSGADLCRLEKPALPEKHLIAYFVVIDREHILLCDHINAELWLPTGGHVEPGEHPRTTVVREVQEELGITGEFLNDGPFFVTETQTVGKTAGHIDVSLWYLLRGQRTVELDFGAREFYAVRWFHKDQVPLDRTDQHMQRFLRKYYTG
jgi:8-oxo-dGTP diphosphatase